MFIVFICNGVFLGSGDERGRAVLRLAFCAVAALVLVTIIIVFACVSHLLMFLIMTVRIIMDWQFNSVENFVDWVTNSVKVLSFSTVRAM